MYRPSLLDKTEVTILLLAPKGERPRLVRAGFRQYEDFFNASAWRSRMISKSFAPVRSAYGARKRPRELLSRGARMINGPGQERRRDRIEAADQRRQDRVRICLWSSTAMGGRGSSGGRLAKTSFERGRAKRVQFHLQDHFTNIHDRNHGGDSYGCHPCPYRKVGQSHRARSRLSCIQRPLPHDKMGRLACALCADRHFWMPAGTRRHSDRKSQAEISLICTARSRGLEDRCSASETERSSATSLWPEPRT